MTAALAITHSVLLAASGNDRCMIFFFFIIIEMKGLIHIQNASKRDSLNVMSSSVLKPVILNEL